MDCANRLTLHYKLDFLTTEITYPQNRLSHLSQNLQSNWMLRLEVELCSLSTDKRIFTSNSLSMLVCPWFGLIVQLRTVKQFYRPGLRYRCINRSRNHIHTPIISVINCLLWAINRAFRESQLDSEKQQKVAKS